jgi:transposase
VAKKKKKYSREERVPFFVVLAVEGRSASAIAKRSSSTIVVDAHSSTLEFAVRGGESLATVVTRLDCNNNVKDWRTVRTRSEKK